MKKLLFTFCALICFLFHANSQDTTSIYRKDSKSSEKENQRSGRVSERRFIRFSIENTSGRSINCYVKGKKPEGGKFSYGFPMKSGQIRNKDWSIGSKVFEVNKLGVRKILTVIEASDEGTVVDLFRAES